MMNSLPLGNATLRRRIVYEPFLARLPETVIWSPGLNMFLVQPSRDMVTSLAASAVHFSPFPVESFTSKESSVWGFINWKSVTVPFKVVNFVVSYADAPWCAKIGAETMRRPIAKPKRVTGLVFMRTPPELPRISHYHQ